MRKTNPSRAADALDKALTERDVQMLAGATTRLELLAKWDAEGRSARQQARAIHSMTVGSKSSPDGLTVTHVTILNWQRARRAGLQQQPSTAIAS